MKNQEYVFDRYRTDHWGNCQRLAQSARVHAPNLELAREKAKLLFPYRSCARDCFVLSSRAKEPK